MFTPEELIFAPTSRCNLACAHCRVQRRPEELPLPAALDFLADAAAQGIERVGFSGGEPFLRLDFLVAVTEAACARGMLFDRLMTNGVWWKDEGELAAALEALASAGFDGTIGLSFDRYHGQAPERLTTFIRKASDAFGRRDAVEILSVRSPEDAPLFEDFRELARGLGGELAIQDGEPCAIVEPRTRRSRRPAADGETLRIDIIRFPYSAAGEVAKTSGVASPGWQDTAWFEDDLCAGPGNVFYVHPDGQVAVCCGFANERPELIAGRIEDGVERLTAAARKKPHVRAAYDEGLGALRARLEAGGVVFPGKTRDICFFCDWLCAQGLAESCAPHS